MVACLPKMANDSCRSTSVSFRTLLSSNLPNRLEPWRQIGTYPRIGFDTIHPKCSLAPHQISSTRLSLPVNPNKDKLFAITSSKKTNKPPPTSSLFIRGHGLHRSHRILVILTHMGLILVPNFSPQTSKFRVLGRNPAVVGLHCRRIHLVPIFQRWQLGHILGSGSVRKSQGVDKIDRQNQCRQK